MAKKTGRVGAIGGGGGAKKSQGPGKGASNRNPNTRKSDASLTKHAKSHARGRGAKTT